MVKKEPDRLLSTEEVMAMVKYSRGSLMRIVRDGRFPAPIQCSGARIAWRLADVQKWIKSLPPATSPGWQRSEEAAS